MSTNVERMEISTDQAPEAVGPYSQAIKVGSRLHTAGQIGLHPETGELVSEHVGEQTKRVLQNLNAIVNEGGGTMSDVVKTTVYLVNMEDYEEVNEVYKRVFEDPYPARSCVEVCTLPKQALVEIDLVAEL